jgi:hypothetical protein
MEIDDLKPGWTFCFPNHCRVTRYLLYPKVLYRTANAFFCMLILDIGVIATFAKPVTPTKLEFQLTQKTL